MFILVRETHLVGLDFSLMLYYAPVRVFIAMYDLVVNS